MRFYRLLEDAWKALYRHPWILLLLPLAVFFPLLDSRGLFELGDANFPLNPFRIDYILPWSAAGSAGADNTFIGVPRLVYHVIINLLIVTTHNLQVSQWLWYSGMAALGIGGAYLLARRLGAGTYAIPLAIVYAFNLWSYDRIAQGPIFISYEALPLAIYLYLRYLARPSLFGALLFSCSLLFVIPALQITYLAFVMCVGIAVREVVLRGWRVLMPLGGLALVVVATNAFYVFSMAADAVLNSGGNIALVNSRFDIGVFEHYAQRVNVPNTLALASFYYSTIDRQWGIVKAAATLIPVMVAALLLLARRPRLRSTFYAGMALALLGIWLVDGIKIAPGAYIWFRDAIPGLRSFVEPDYFSPLYIVGVFVMLAAGARLGARAYAGWWKPLIWLTALGGIIPFLPISGHSSGLPQTGQPRQYAEFSRAHVQGKTLWLPPERGVRYSWSPYTINGFTSLNSPSDAVGPEMAETVGVGTALLEERLSHAFDSGQLRTVEALAPRMGVGTVAIAADSLTPGNYPDPRVNGALATFRLLQRGGFLSPRNDYHDVGVHLVTGITRPPLPELGMYDEPAYVGSYENFMWWQLLSSGKPYTPLIVDAPGAGPIPGLSIPRVAPPPVLKRSVAPKEMYTAPCTDVDKPLAGITSFPTTLTAPYYITCLTYNLGNLRRFEAVSFKPNVAPGSYATADLRFTSPGHDEIWVDPTDPAQEIPAWARTGLFMERLPPYTSMELRGLTMRWVPAGETRAIPAPHTCVSSGVTWSKQNPMMYVLRGNASGTCAVVFRQTFANPWRLFSSGSGIKVFGHVHVDGFANGWVVDAHGPFSLRVVNVMIYPYAIGMVLTVAMLLLTLGLFVLSRLRRGARARESRLPTPA